MEATLEANRRDTIGKNEARRTRRAGRVPAVVYGAASVGASREATSIDVDPKALLRILHSDSGANTLISLKVAGAEDKVLVRDYLLDPVTHAILHADFYRVAMDKLLRITVPVVVKGEAKGAKLQGGIIEFVRREIEIECFPGDIPEHVEVDVTELMVHDGVRVRDIAHESKWKPLLDPDTMLLHVILPKAEAAAATADAAAPAATSEPEVVKKGKKDEDSADKKDDKKK
ncbi:MAG: 50S ribosomal protein L25 [Vicinamibacterales bacterium]